MTDRRNLFVVDGQVVRIREPFVRRGRRCQVVYLSLTDYGSDYCNTVPFLYRLDRTDLSHVRVGDTVRTAFTLHTGTLKGLTGYLSVCRGGTLNILRSARAEREAEERRKAEEVGELLEELKR